MLLLLLHVIYIALRILSYCKARNALESFIRSEQLLTANEDSTTIDTHTLDILKNYFFPEDLDGEKYKKLYII